MAVFTLSWFPSQALPIGMSVSNGWRERRYTACWDIFARWKYVSDLQGHRVALGSLKLHAAADCSRAAPIVGAGARTVESASAQRLKCATLDLNIQRNKNFFAFSSAKRQIMNSKQFVCPAPEVDGAIMCFSATLVQLRRKPKASLNWMYSFRFLRALLN